MGKIFYQILRPITDLYVDIVYSPKIYNKCVIPKTGGIIFVGNHLTDMDQTLVIRSTTRCVHFLTKKELYHGLLGRILKWYDTIPVDRNAEKNNAMEISKEYLLKGEAINIFPEGKRNKTNEILLEFKFGAVALSKKTDSYIVPFGICGKMKPFKKGVVVNFGTPYKVKGDLEAENEKLRKIIIELINKGREEYDKE